MLVRDEYNPTKRGGGGKEVGGGWGEGEFAIQMRGCLLEIKTSNRDLREVIHFHS